MHVDIERLVEDLREDIMEGVRLGLVSGTLPREMIVMLLDTGARIGTDPRPLVFTVEREAIDWMTDPATYYIEILRRGARPSVDPGLLRARALRILREKFGAQLDRDVDAETLVICVVVGDRTAVVDQRISGDSLN